MRRLAEVVLGFLMVAVCIGSAISEPIKNCYDQQCRSVRLIIQNEQDLQQFFNSERSVQHLDVHGNFLRSFPRIRAQLVSLNVSYNFIKEISLEGMYGVETVDLTYNELGTVAIPASVKTFIAVRNKLGSIQLPSYGSKLQRLNLAMNHLDQLYDIPKQRELVELDLSCNRIRMVNFGEFQSIKLEHLNLANNHIHEVSGQLAHLRSLKELNLANNILTVMDDSLTSSSLTGLYLQNNAIIMNLQSANNKRYPNLQSLDIAGNRWKCDKLRELLNANSNVRLSPEAKPCQDKQEKGICCGDMSYADHLIEYRKQEWRALGNGTAQLTQPQLDCSTYQPNPCDGDDGMVLRVAQNSLKDVEYNAADKEQIRAAELAGLNQNLAYANQDKQDRENKLQLTQNLLAGVNSFIDREYQAAGLSQPVQNGVDKIKKLLEKYDRDEVEIMEKIKEKEIRNQDQSDANNRLNEQLEELKREEEDLQQELAGEKEKLKKLNDDIEKLNVKLRNAGLA